MHDVEDPSYPQVVTVGCVNFASVLHDKPATVAKMEGFVRDAARQGCDLVVFPELALTGWLPGEPELVPGPSTDALAAVAAELGVHVIFGLEEQDPDAPDCVYNASVVIAPDGILGTYRKIHLGIPLESRFTPGDALPVWQTRLGPIGVLICYDFWSNPELARILALKGARLLVNTTGSKVAPAKRDYIVNTTVVRAQENLVYAASANRVDDHDGGEPYAGHSCIAGPAFPAFNKVYAEAGSGEELVVASLNFAQLARWYDVFPWREWRLGAQGYASELIAREFNAIAADVSASTVAVPTPMPPTTSVR